MIVDKPANFGKIEVDLTGPQGNAFSLLGLASTLSKKLGFSEEKKNTILEAMQMSDYENLVEIFDKNFGDFVVLYR